MKEIDKRFKPNKEIALAQKGIDCLDNLEVIKQQIPIEKVSQAAFNDYIKRIEAAKVETLQSEKPLNIGMATLRNEEECVVGWAKTMLHFCNEVYALIDPATTDQTAVLLKTRFPQIKILWQDRSLGDSDNEIKGEKSALIMHANYNYFINELVDKNELFMLLSADERFYTPEFSIIEKEIEFMKEHNQWNGWYIPQHRMWQFADNLHVIDFSVHTLKQYKIFRLVSEYKHGLPQHSGWNWKDFRPAIKSRANWFHYCFIKDTRPAFGYWRDIKQFKKYPRIQFTNPIPYWRTLPELTDKGEFLNA